MNIKKVLWVYLGLTAVLIYLLISFVSIKSLGPLLLTKGFIVIIILRILGTVAFNTEFLLHTPKKEIKNAIKEKKITRFCVLDLFFYIFIFLGIGVLLLLALDYENIETKIGLDSAFLYILFGVISFTFVRKGLLERYILKRTFKLLKNKEDSER